MFRRRPIDMISAQCVRSSFSEPRDRLRSLRRVGCALVVCTTWSAPTAAFSGALPENAAVLARIERLAANEAVHLGKAQVVGPFNEVARRFDLHLTGPRSRNYSLKMNWAPDRRRALFVGANHGKPHRLNDVWEFDLAALSWILLYAPDNPRSYDGLGDDPSDVVFEDGILRSRRGGPAVIGHTWWGTTYDPVRKQLLFMNIWLTKQGEAIKQLGGDPEVRYKGPPLWAFDPAAGNWQAIKTSPPGPNSPYGAMLEYVPPLGGAVWHMNNWQMRATWLFDSEARRWRQLPVNRELKDFGAQAPKSELVGYYDAARNLIVAQQGKSTFHFDVARKEWKRVRAESPESSNVPRGHDARTAFYHDPVSGFGLLIDFRERLLWSYNPDRVEWKRLEPNGDPMPAGQRMLAYVDPVRNVLVVLDDASAWAYRFSAVDQAAVLR